MQSLATLIRTQYPTTDAVHVLRSGSLYAHTIILVDADGKTLLKENRSPKQNWYAWLDEMATDKATFGKASERTTVTDSMGVNSYFEIVPVLKPAYTVEVRYTFPSSEAPYTRTRSVTSGVDTFAQAVADAKWHAIRMQDEASNPAYSLTYRQVRAFSNLRASACRTNSKADYTHYLIATATAPKTGCKVELFIKAN